MVTLNLLCNYLDYDRVYINLYVKLKIPKHGRVLREHYIPRFNLVFNGIMVSVDNVV